MRIKRGRVDVGAEAKSEDKKMIKMFRTKNLLPLDLGERKATIFAHSKAFGDAVHLGNHGLGETGQVSALSSQFVAAFEFWQNGGINFICWDKRFFYLKAKFSQIRDFLCNSDAAHLVLLW